MMLKRITRENFDSSDAVASAYGRVSSTKLEQQISMEYQIEGLEDEFKRHPKWVDSGLRYNDDGKTGTSIFKRYDFQRMLADAKLGKFNLIIIRDVSRFARYAKEFLIYLEELQKCRVEVYFTSYGVLSNDPFAKNLLTSFASQAESESEHKSKFTKDGHKKRKERGFIFGSKNRFGWDLIITDKGESNKLEIIEDEAKIIKLIFDLYINGLVINGVRETSGMRKIAAYLNSNGFKTKTGANWYTSTINDILHNKCLCGYIAYNKSYKKDMHDERRKNRNREDFVYVKSDNVAIIIDEETFLKAQDLAKGRTKVSSKPILDENGQPKRDSNSNIIRMSQGYKPITDIYAQKMVCECNSTLKVHRIRRALESGEKPIGYTCYRYDATSINSKTCINKTFDKVKLDMVALKIFGGFMKDNEKAIKLAYEMIISCYKAEKASHITKDPKDLQKKIERFKRKKISLFNDYTEDKMKDEEYYERDNLLRSKIEETERELTILMNELKDVSTFDEKIEKTKIKVALSMVGTTFKNEFGYDEVTHEIISSYVSKVVTHADGSFDWYLNLKGACDNYSKYHNKFSKDYKERYEINPNANIINEFCIGYEEANEFVEKWRKTKFQFAKKDGTPIWRDINVKVFVEF
jgi:site-specific DNA recombinase